MPKLTKEHRQEIVREFAVRHNGRFNAALFRDEVERSGPDHPAHPWFTWDTSKAARAYQVDEARNFARDLRVTFSIEEVRRNQSVKVRQTTVPLVISPVKDRANGGGHVLTDHTNPEHMAEHSRQAAEALRSWIRRYEAVAIQAGVSIGSLEQMAAALENHTEEQKQIAA